MSEGVNAQGLYEFALSIVAIEAPTANVPMAGQTVEGSNTQQQPAGPVGPKRKRFLTHETARKLMSMVTHVTDQVCSQLNSSWVGTIPD